MHNARDEESSEEAKSACRRAVLLQAKQVIDEFGVNNKGLKRPVMHCCKLEDALLTFL